MANLLLEQSYVIDQGYNKHQSTFLNIFWVGFILYTISFTYGTTGAVTNSLVELFQLLGIALFSLASLALIKFRLANQYFKAIYICIN